MTTAIREVVFSIRHDGCPVSDSSEAVPEVRLSTVSKIEKENNRLKSILHIQGTRAKNTEFIETIRTHPVTSKVVPLPQDPEVKTTHIILTVDYEAAIPSISNILSSYDCFQPNSVSVERGFENWPVYLDDAEMIAAISEQFRKLGFQFEVRRNVGLDSLPHATYELTSGETDDLTNRQLEVLVTAQQLGYYETNSEVRMVDIADHLDLSSATVCEHINRAENKIISNVLSKVHPVVGYKESPTPAD